MTIVPTFIRSQRDIVGEKEAVRQLIEQTEQQLATVEQKLSGAEPLSVCRFISLHFSNLLPGGKQLGLGKKTL